MNELQNSNSSRANSHRLRLAELKEEANVMSFNVDGHSNDKEDFNYTDDDVQDINYESDNGNKEMELKGCFSRPKLGGKSIKVSNKRGQIEGSGSKKRA
jgi:hypothetical protein